MVFTELLEMVEERFSLDVVDDVLTSTGLAGAYTAVGDYQDADLVAIVHALSDRTGVSVHDLLVAYGEHLFGRFAVTHGFLLGEGGDMYTFLAGLESHVHTEVRKLYAASKPSLFSSTWSDDGAFELDYRSERALWPFALGLLHGCFAHFGVTPALAHEDLSGGAGTHVRFTLTPATPDAN